jgi:hypothetical protein
VIKIVHEELVRTLGEPGRLSCRGLCPMSSCWSDYRDRARRRWWQSWPAI